VRERIWGVGLCDRDERGSRGWVCANEFWKMVYGNFFRKPFSPNSLKDFTVKKTNVFR
jgi:hypothetical protein